MLLGRTLNFGDLKSWKFDKTEGWKGADTIFKRVGKLPANHSEVWKIAETKRWKAANTIFKRLGKLPAIFSEGGKMMPKNTLKILFSLFKIQLEFRRLLNLKS